MRPIRKHPMITSSFAILSILSLVVVTPVVAFFLIRDWHEMLAWIDADLPRDSVDTIRLVAQEIDQTLAGFVHGQALVCLILAVYYGTALSVAGLESALALGLLIGVLAIVPVAGAAAGFALSVALAALQYGTWTNVAVVCGIFIFGQTVEANLLTPKLVGDRIHLHPVWVIFALLAGGKLFGFLGPSSPVRPIHCRPSDSHSSPPRSSRGRRPPGWTSTSALPPRRHVSDLRSGRRPRRPAPALSIPSC